MVALRNSARFVAGLAAASMVLASCGLLPHEKPKAPRCGEVACPTTYKQLLSYPIATLYYPGSKVLGHSGADVGFAGASAPFAGAFLSTPASPHQVYLFYELWLLSHGWRHCPTGLTAGDEVSDMGYAKGKWQEFSIGIDDTQGLSEDANMQVPKGGTAYETAFFYGPDSGGTPTTCAPPGSDVGTPRKYLHQMTLEGGDEN